jgi:carbamate kinase
MGPKIESALAYLDAGGQEVLITTAEALTTEDPATVGTRIVRG